MGGVDEHWVSLRITPNFFFLGLSVLAREADAHHMIGQCLSLRSSMIRDIFCVIQIQILKMKLLR